MRHGANCSQLPRASPHTNQESEHSRLYSFQPEFPFSTLLRRRLAYPAGRGSASILRSMARRGGASGGSPPSRASNSERASPAGRPSHHPLLQADSTPRCLHGLQENALSAGRLSLYGLRLKRRKLFQNCSLSIDINQRQLVILIN